MPDSTIGNLPAGSPAQSSDQFPIQRGAANFKLLTSDIQAGLAPLASPAFTGTPTSPTNSNSGDASTQIATDAFVQNAVSATLSVVQSTRVVVTAAELNALNGTAPLTILTAPPANRAYFPIAVTYEYKFGVSPFVGFGTSFTLYYGVTNGSTFDNGFGDTFIVAQTQSQLSSNYDSGQALFEGSGYLNSTLSAQAIVLDNIGGQTTSGVGSTVVITIFYAIIIL